MKLKIIDKYNKMPVQIKATFWFLLCSVFQNAISFLTTPIFTRMMNTEQFGQYSLYLTWLSFVEIFATLMLWGGSFNKAMLDFEKERKEYISAIQGLTTVITLILCVIFIFVNKEFTLLTGLRMPVMVCMFIQLLFLPAFQFWSQCQKYEYKYKYYVIFSLIMYVISPVIAILMVSSATNKGEARIFALVITESLFNIFFYIYNFKEGKKFYSKTYWKYALSFNLVLIPHYIANSVLTRADRIMIGYFCDEYQVGIYSLIYNLAMILQLVTNSIGASITPWIYKKLKNNEQREVRRIALYLQSAFGVLAIIICLFGPEIVWFMGGKAYMEGVYIIPPVICSSFCIFVTVLLNAVEYYYAAKKEILIATVCSAVCNVILNFVFIPHYGYVAAAYTTLVSYCLFEFMHIFFLSRIEKKNKMKVGFFNYKLTVLQTLILVVLTTGISIFYTQYVMRYLISIILFGVVLINTKKIKKIFIEMRE